MTGLCMSISTNDLRRLMDLRSRAVSKLSGRSSSEQPLTASAAFNVLHALASSPSTAADAMALLHELQVHQVELDLQFEELQSSRVHLEASLDRQSKLYDFAPVALFTIDQKTALLELNLAGAILLGQERHLLLGQALQNYLTPDSKSALNAMMARVRAGVGVNACAVQLAMRDAPTQTLLASISADPSGAGFLVALSAHGAT